MAGLNIGDKANDGTIYAGISPDNGKQMFVTSDDEPVRANFRGAKKLARAFNKKESDPEKKTWHVPTIGELQALAANKDAIGGMDYKGGWRRWSSTSASWTFAKTLDPDSGNVLNCHKRFAKLVRLVRYG